MDPATACTRADAAAQALRGVALLTGLCHRDLHAPTVRAVQAHINRCADAYAAAAAG